MFKTYKNWLIEENKNKYVTVLYPGSFKCLHLGHRALIDKYTNNPMVKQLDLLIGAGTRDGIDQNTSYEIAKILLSNNKKVKIQKVDPNNPKMRSPIGTSYEYIKTASPGTYALAASSKGDDYSRVQKFVKEHQKDGKYYDTIPKDEDDKPLVKVIELNVDVEPAIYEGRSDEYNKTPISASILRNDVIKLHKCNKKCKEYNILLSNFYSNYRNIDRESVNKVLDILLKKVKFEEKLVEESYNKGLFPLKVQIPYEEVSSKRFPHIIHFNNEKNETVYGFDPTRNLVWFYDWEKPVGDRLTILNRDKQIDLSAARRIIANHIKKNKLQESLLNEEDITAQVNKHMTHLEDLAIMSGSKGLDWAVNMLINLYDEMKGETPKNKIGLSVKIDGSPACFCWSNFPGLEQPGIAIKGLFAKEPKVAFTEEDIQRMYGDRPDLAYKLGKLLEYLPQLNIPEGEIWQGDFLFDDKSLKIINIKDEKHYAFQPNTIMYVTPINSDLGDKISNAEIGIVWHTRYKGSDLLSIKANYDVSITELNGIPEVFMTDPYIKSFAGLITFNKEQSEAIENELIIAQDLIEELKHDKSYDEIINNEKITSIIAIYQNSLIRSNKQLNSQTFADEFNNFLKMRYQKEIDAKKSIEGKKKYEMELNNLLNILEKNKNTLTKIAEIINILANLKQKFINKLNNIASFDTYLNTKNGEMRKTGQEGFAVSDNLGNIIKIVDRAEFSYANFSSDIIKGWEK